MFVKGLRHVPREERLRQLNLNADASELTLIRLTSSSAHLEPAYEGTPIDMIVKLWKKGESYRNI